MAKKVNYNDGEAVNHADLNTQQQRQRIELMRHWASAVMVDTNYTVQACNPTKVRPAVAANTLTMGITHWAFPVTPATVDDPTAVLAELPAINQAVTATTATFFRQDIIAVKLDEDVSAAAVSIDFEDATTRALSTPTAVKTISDNISFEVVEGVEQTTEALALANPPTPTAGFTAVAGYILADTGAHVDTLVLVPPTGQRTKISLPILSDYSNANASTWTILGGFWFMPTSAAQTILEIAHRVPYNMFIEKVIIHHRLKDQAGTGTYRLNYNNHQGIGTSSLFLDFKSLITLPSSTTEELIIDLATEGVAPAWTRSDTKGHHPNADGAYMEFRFQESSDAILGSEIRAIELEGVIWNQGGNE